MAWINLLLPLLALSSSVPQAYANPVTTTSYSAGAGRPPISEQDCSVQPTTTSFSQAVPVSTSAPSSGSSYPGSGSGSSSVPGSSQPGSGSGSSSPSPGSGSGSAPSSSQPGSGSNASCPGSNHDDGFPGIAYVPQTREFWLNITWEDGAPDGVTRKMFHINGQSPGPVLECTQGDEMVVHVINQSPIDIAIHWHGIEQYLTPYSDGTPGVAQLAIKPGDTFIYSFRATQYGAYMYHGHDRNQIEDGLTGALIIHPYHDAPRPFHMIDNSTEAIEAMIQAERKAKAILITEWNHFTSEEKEQVTLNAGMECTCYHSVLFNGKGRVYCPDVDKIMPFAMPGLLGILGIVPGSNLTDYACIPAANMLAVAGGPGGGGNISAVPPGLFSGCKATDTDLEIITVGKDQWVAFHIIHASSFITPLLSIDEHDIWVFAVDGSYITPQKINAAPLYNAQRIAIMFKTSQAGEFKISIDDFAAPQMISGHAILHVQGDNATSLADSKPYVDAGGNPVSKDVIVFNDSIASPFPSSPVQPADVLFKLNMTLVGAFNWGLNYTPMDVAKVEDNPKPVLYGGPSPNTHDNLTIVTEYDQWVDMCFVSAEPLPHSLHKHSNMVYIIGRGDGDFVWDSVEEAAKARPEAFNLKNPPMRDTWPSLPAAAPGALSFTCVRYHVLNPGPYLLHCHIGTHFRNGMAIIMRDAEDMWPQPPTYYELKANGTDIVWDS